MTEALAQEEEESNIYFPEISGVNDISFSREESSTNSDGIIAQCAHLLVRVVQVGDDIQPHHVDQVWHKVYFREEQEAEFRPHSCTATGEMGRYR